MKLLHDLNSAVNLQNSFLFFDTNVLIAANKYKEPFANIFQILKNKGCDFVTIPSVFFEFTRGTKSIADFNARAEFLKA